MIKKQGVHHCVQTFHSPLILFVALFINFLFMFHFLIIFSSLSFSAIIEFFSDFCTYTKLFSPYQLLVY